jgi:predicted transcriptional regulator
MSKTLQAIHLLEDKLKTLLANYEFLKEENEILLQNVGKLQSQLNVNLQIIEDQNKKHELLKIAKTIDGSNDSTRETKLKINALIREIDKCIVQLNE